jgi:hypothetical protein
MASPTGAVCINFPVSEMLFPLHAGWNQGKLAFRPMLYSEG